MANYSYIDFKPKMDAVEVEQLLKAVVLERFKGLVEVKVAGFDPELGCTNTWLVVVPGTALYDEAEARKAWRCPGEDIGFMVARHRGGKQLVFRHGPCTHFETWLRGCTAERLVRRLKAKGIFYDAIDKVEKRGPKSKDRYDYPTFKEHLARKFVKPLTAEDEAYFNENFRWQAPNATWWDGSAP